MSKYKVESHFHTKESSPCGWVVAEEGVKLYRIEGYDAIIVTDHFSQKTLSEPGEADWKDVCDVFLEGYRKARTAAANSDMKIFLGMEIRFPNSSNDYLVYGIKEEFPYEYPWLYMKDLEFLYGLAADNNLLIVQAHPFRGACQLAPVGLLHGIEVMNANPRQNSRNELAREAAREYGMPGFTGSDFHRIGDLTGFSMELETMPESEQELVRLLKKAAEKELEV